MVRQIQKLAVLPHFPSSCLTLNTGHTETLRCLISRSQEHCKKIPWPIIWAHWHLSFDVTHSIFSIIHVQISTAGTLIQPEIQIHRFTSGRRVHHLVAASSYRIIHPSCLWFAVTLICCGGQDAAAELRCTGCYFCSCSWWDSGHAPARRTPKMVSRNPSLFNR